MKAACEKAFLWGVVAPLAAYVLGLKVLRVLMTVKFSSGWILIELVRSDILVLVGFAALGVFLLRNLQKFIGFSPVLWVLQSFAVMWAILESIAHRFFIVTGSFFDVYLLTFSIKKLGDTFSVISSEAPISYLLPLLAVLLLLLLLPGVLLKKYSAAVNKEETQPASLSWAGHLGLLAICFIATVFATIPAKGEDFAYVSRSNLINIVMTIDQATDVSSSSLVREPVDSVYFEPRDNTVASERKRRNLVFIILESTRAQSTTLHNKQLQTTPFLASLAGTSLEAERAYAVVPHTSKALVAILCGVEPKLSMPITEALPGGIPAPCLANMLKEVGYKSVFLQSATQRFESRAGLVRNMGYDDFIPLEAMDATGLEKANYFGPEDAVMLEPSERWLKKNAKDGPFFATYLTLSPHHNYLAPRERYGHFNFSPEPELNNYLNALHYVDQFARELIEQYKRLGLYENTLFVILGDHGEGFGEHGRHQHDNVIWEEGLHVPLLIHDPSNPVGEKIPYPVSQLDLVPTLSEMLDFEIAGGHLPGIPFSQAAEDRKVYGHCWYQMQCLAVIGQRYKLIDHFGKRYVEYYDLKSDPAETRNLASSMNEDLKHQFRSDLYAWRQSVNDLYDRKTEVHVASHQ